MTGAKHIIQSFRESVSGFLHAALVFAVAMLGATVSRNYEYKNQGELDADGVLFYSLLGSAFISTFSIFPCLVLQPLLDAKNLSTSRYSRLFLWCLVISLAVTVWILSFPNIDNFFQYTEAADRLLPAQLHNTSYASMTRDDELLLSHMNQTGFYRAVVWEHYCSDGDLSRYLRTVLRVGVAIQVPGLLYCLFATLAAIVFESNLPPCTYLRAHFGRVFAKPAETNRLARLLVGSLYLAAALVFLGFYYAYRWIIKHRAPSTDADSDWSFGQILALAQLVPVGLEFMSALRTTWRSKTSVHDPRKRMA